MEFSDSATSTSYAASGFSNRMGFGKRPALLIIDVCRAYWTSSSPLDITANPAAAASPDSMRRLLAAAREAQIPVLWTQVKYEKADMADAGLFWLKTRALDVWKVGDNRGLHECVDGLTLSRAKLWWRRSTQCMNVDTLIICGVSTSGCVRASTLDAMQYGFRPMVVGSACGDRTPEIHNANLFDLNAKYADVVTEYEAVERIARGWMS